MTQRYCTDKAALIGFLYDDCEPGERDRIAAHVADCPDCTAELASLGATRRQLGAWVPPQAALGFQVDAAQMAESLRSAPAFAVLDGGHVDIERSRPAAPWWKQPLPAWAHAAAAVLIFAAGVGFGAGNRATVPDVASVQPPTSRAASPDAVRRTEVVATTAPAAVAPAELARLEQQLKVMQAQLAALRENAGRRAPGASDGITLAQVKDLLAASETRLQKELVLRDAAFQAARTSDMQRIGTVIDPLQRVHAQQLWQQGEPAQSLSGPVIGLRNVSLKR